MAAERPPEPLHALRVLSVETPDRRLVEETVAGLSRRIAVPCRLGEAPPELQVPVLASRDDQADADRLLERVETLVRDPGEWVVGLLALDLGNPIFTFFFGRARHHGQAAVVSFARLSPRFYGLEEDRGLTAHRTVLETTHELGHLAGLEHCADNRCIMRFAPTVEAIDNRGTTFCTSCSEGLPPAFAPSFANVGGEASSG